MHYSELKQGEKIQMYHHHHEISGNYFWKDGIVGVRKHHKVFVPDKHGTPLLIVPHRMDEIRIINTNDRH